MDLFEYLVVMVSIVLGLSVTQVLRGLGKVVRNQSRFPPIIIWAIVLFYIHIQVWWGLWDLSNITSWNMFSFYLLIAIPCSMFAAVELLLPLSSDADTDWEAHFSGEELVFRRSLPVFDHRRDDNLFSQQRTIDPPVSNYPGDSNGYCHRGIFHTQHKGAYLD